MARDTDEIISTADWRRLLARDAAAAAAFPLYGRLVDGPVVLGRIAQSLDGRIATVTGASAWISGPADILHTHRLRALFDVVLVGAGTIRADDPLLTTRHCDGASPVRVVLDADRRLAESYKVFRDGPATLVVSAADSAGGDRVGVAEVVRVPRDRAGGLDLAAVLAMLRARGLGRVFIEGGGVTGSRFLAAGLLDRLHVTVAPLHLGSGITAVTLPEVARPDDGIRFGWQTHRLGNDVLFDVDLRA